jgi:5,10-methylene-tetrahydrofolate dehydrogenase/methenyl tetrahydrofolate cyclohydrolase
MKLLDGEELAGYIKERQAHEVRALRQAWKVQPRLLVGADWPPALQQQVREYCEDILVETGSGEASGVLGQARVMAVQWLLAGYNVDLQSGRTVLMVGQDAALFETLNASGVKVLVAEPDGPKLKDAMLAADVIIVNASQPAAIYPNMIKPGAVVLDASNGGAAIAESVYDRDDITVTPPKNGLEPLVVCALLESVIRTARGAADRG